MITRTAFFALGLTLAACNQGAAPADPAADAASRGNELSVGAQLLTRSPSRGSWEAVGDEASTGVRFTSSDNGETLTIGCNQGLGDAFVVWTHQNPINITNPVDERFPTQNGEMRIDTAAETVNFAATGSNIDGHMLSVSVPSGDPRLAVLKAPLDRFAVSGFGQAIIVPWAAGIADALNECAG